MSNDSRYKGKPRGGKSRGKGNFPSRSRGSRSGDKRSGDKRSGSGRGRPQERETRGSGRERFQRHQKFDGIFYTRNPKRYLTENYDIGRATYGEKLYPYKGSELRAWNPDRSKLCAALHKNVRDIFITSKSNILYLGASSGTTVSHVSDIAVNGTVYAVEFSPRSLRELIQNTTDRPNVVPILADANQPYEYAKYIIGNVDVIYQDIAQPNQSEILINNAKRFLKKDGHVLLCIKAKSINPSKPTVEIFNEEIDKLKANNFTIRETINIAPYQDDHRFITGIYRGN